MKLQWSNPISALAGMCVGAALACAAPTRKASAPAPAPKPGFRVGMKASRPGTTTDPTVDWVDVCMHRDGGGHATTRVMAGEARIDRVVFFDAACKSSKTTVPSALCQAGGSLAAQATQFVAACAKSGGCDL